MSLVDRTTRETVHTHMPAHHHNTAFSRFSNSHMKVSAMATVNVISDMQTMIVATFKTLANAASPGVQDSVRMQNLIKDETTV
jgi:hypothetical protein